jgi:cellulose biosynthesis protein BcsQ
MNQKTTTISFISTKGGVSKTSSCLSTAFILSEDHKVLLIDMDSNNSTTSHFVSNIDSITGKTIRQVFKGEIEIEDAIIPINQSLHLVPSEIELCLLERELVGMSNQVFLLHDALSQIADHYDYILIDTPPFMGLHTKLSIIVSDKIVIPVTLWTNGVLVQSIYFYRDRGLQESDEVYREGDSEDYYPPNYVHREPCRDESIPQDSPRVISRLPVVNNYPLLYRDYQDVCSRGILFVKEFTILQGVPSTFK